VFTPLLPPPAPHALRLEVTLERAFTADEGLLSEVLAQDLANALYLPSEQIAVVELRLGGRFAVFDILPPDAFSHGTRLRDLFKEGAKQLLAGQASRSLALGAGLTLLHSDGEVEPFDPPAAQRTESGFQGWVRRVHGELAGARATAASFLSAYTHLGATLFLGETEETNADAGSRLESLFAVLGTVFAFAGCAVLCCALKLISARRRAGGYRYSRQLQVGMCGEELPDTAAVDEVPSFVSHQDENAPSWPVDVGRRVCGDTLESIRPADVDSEVARLQEAAAAGGVPADAGGIGTTPATSAVSLLHQAAAACGVPTDSQLHSTAPVIKYSF